MPLSKKRGGGNRKTKTKVSLEPATEKVNEKKKQTKNQQEQVLKF